MQEMLSKRNSLNVISLQIQDIQSGMSKLSSKLNRHENNFKILLYQVYLPTFYENILKYFRLDFFKEITFDFNQRIQKNLESSTSLSNGLLI